jgi:hypothetical protein
MRTLSRGRAAGEEMVDGPMACTCRLLRHRKTTRGRLILRALEGGRLLPLGAQECKAARTRRGRGSAEPRPRSPSGTRPPPRRRDLRAGDGRQLAPADGDRRGRAHERRLRSDHALLQLRAQLPAHTGGKLRRGRCRTPLACQPAAAGRHGCRDRPSPTSVSQFRQQASSRRGRFTGAS